MFKNKKELTKDINIITTVFYLATDKHIMPNSHNRVSKYYVECNHFQHRNSDEHATHFFSDHLAITASIDVAGVRPVINAPAQPKRFNWSKINIYMMAPFTVIVTWFIQDLLLC